jgi:outer membrane protein assembly factor BamA
MTVFWFDAQRQRDSTKNFIEAKLKAEAIFDESSKQVSYGIEISEGTQYRMGNLIITGLSEKDLSGIRKKWKIAEGEIYNASYINVFMNAPPTNRTPKSIRLKRDQQKHTVDVVIEF